MTTQILVISIVLFALVSPSLGEHDNTECRSNSNCGPGHCCTISPMRYSLPQCRSFQEVGDICRPGSISTINLTLGYPDGSEISLHDVHYILCPCAVGSFCDPKEGVCKDTEEKRDSNRLTNENVKQED